MLTLLVARLTETRAVLGEPSLMLPSPAFWMAPAPMETFPAVAPFINATGMPPIRAQGPPHRPLETESRLPPDPPNDTSPPPILASDPPLTARSGLPLRRATRSPPTLRTLPPLTLTRAPMATARRLASRLTSDDDADSRLVPVSKMASVALVSALPFLRRSKGAVASRSAVSMWRTWLVVTVAPSDSKRAPPVLSGVSVAKVRPLSTSVAVPLPIRSNMATSVPRACVPPLRKTSGSSVEETNWPPGSTESRLTGAVRLVSMARRRGPARLTFPPGATIMTESKLADPPVYSTRGSRLVRVTDSPARTRYSGGSSGIEIASRSTPEAKLASPTSPISKMSEATPDSGASQEKATCLKPVNPQPHVGQLPPALKPAAPTPCVETWFGVKAVFTVSVVSVALCPFGPLTRMSNVSLNGLLPRRSLTEWGYSLRTRLSVALMVYSVPAVTWKGCDRLLN